MLTFLLSFFSFLFLVAVCMTTPFHFLRYYASASCNGVPQDVGVVEEIASNLIEYSLLDVNSNVFLPSIIALGAVVCARGLVGMHPQVSEGLIAVSRGVLESCEALEVDVRACCEHLMRFSPYPAVTMCPTTPLSSPTTAQSVAALHGMPVVDGWAFGAAAAACYA